MAYRERVRVRELGIKRQGGHFRKSRQTSKPRTGHWIDVPSIVIACNFHSTALPT